ncbi:dTDP-4-dehydrorhamnose reductase (plasmid) [Sulfitobacter sp. DSM 110093]|uniref:dTDP-4-dehydrorhamnose reductase n=1 Tax=Sulfitobacter sp. DSM 110093 TaxID=2883127 RepID=UPI001FAB740E|nr:dTDP-4-dehydrorhamnose reductase [Sulfitobacter sp. DSM 110093]UOA34088.1 dTDP-4-dehydrorhamnose reductase [Sulfitobacter sp. DSM 110093]
MSLLVFGTTGQLAVALRKLAHGGQFLDRAAADLTNPAVCAAVIRAARPSAVINAAAYTAVDRAEADEAFATVINAEAPGAMARACAELGVPFLHVSTDYVFNGSGQSPWRPDDPISPINAYGRSKATGEAAVRAAGGAHAILRTSWVFSALGSNFVTTMLRLSESRDSLKVVDDQVGGPTPALAIAETLLQMAAEMTAGQGGGTYHYAGAPATSWECFAREIFAIAGRPVDVIGIPTSDYPTPAKRPLNSRLNCGSLERDFGITHPDWRPALEDIVKELS